jgi:hypothetical protein
MEHCGGQDHDDGALPWLSAARDRARAGACDARATAGAQHGCRSATRAALGVPVDRFPLKEPD